jgi:hypothetical protein
LKRVIMTATARNDQGANRFFGGRDGEYEKRQNEVEGPTYHKRRRYGFQYRLAMNGAGITVVLILRRRAAVCGAPAAALRQKDNACLRTSALRLVFDTAALRKMRTAAGIRTNCPRLKPSLRDLETDLSAVIALFFQCFCRRSTPRPPHSTRAAPRRTSLMPGEC